MFQNQKVHVLYVIYTELTLINAIPRKVNDSYIGSVCQCLCKRIQRLYMKDKCGVFLADVCKSKYLLIYTVMYHITLCCFCTVCSQDPIDQHYCFTYNKILNTSGQYYEAVQGPCATKDCSDPTCNAAVKNVR